MYNDTQHNKQLIKNGEVIDDGWVYVADDAPLGDAPTIITLQRLKDETEALQGNDGRRNTPLGVVLQAANQGKQQMGEDVRELADYLDMVTLVAIEFPVYRNGRGYSAARLLREQLQFDGEIRAIGEVLCDQWQFMARCGINAFEIDAGIAVQQFNTAIGALSDAYQPAADGQRGVLWRRHSQQGS